jgi:hypothetical protein
MENQRLAARNKLLKQFEGKKVTISNKSKPEQHMAITSLQQSYLDLPDSDNEKIWLCMFTPGRIVVYTDKGPRTRSESAILANIPFPVRVVEDPHNPNQVVNTTSNATLIATTNSSTQSSIDDMANLNIPVSASTMTNTAVQATMVSSQGQSCSTSTMYGHTEETSSDEENRIRTASRETRRLARQEESKTSELDLIVAIVHEALAYGPGVRIPSSISSFNSHSYASGSSKLRCC